MSKIYTQRRTRINESSYKNKKLKVLILICLVGVVWLLSYMDNLDKNKSRGDVTSTEFKKNLEKFKERIGVNRDNITSKNNVILEYKKQSEEINNITNIFETDLKKITKFEYLKNNYYSLDPKTDITSEKLDANKFLKTDLKISNDTNGYKILIFHTHGSETYKDSKNLSEGIIGVGEELKKILESKYGIKTLHIKDRYDFVDGNTQILGSYERMSDPIEKILQNNPSIEVVLDLHRDGVPDDTRLVKTINGKEMAQIMFVNGLTEVKLNGQLNKLYELPNPWIDENLAFSFNMLYNGNLKYNGMFRKIYLHAYRYSLHLKPKSLLVEVGAQTNTFEEAKNSMEVFAEILIGVIK